MQEELLALERQGEREKKQAKSVEDCEIELRLCFDSVPQVNILTRYSQVDLLRQGIRALGSSDVQRGAGSQRALQGGELQSEYHSTPSHIALGVSGPGGGVSERADQSPVGLPLRRHPPTPRLPAAGEQHAANHPRPQVRPLLSTHAQSLHEVRRGNPHHSPAVGSRVRATHQQPQEGAATRGPLLRC